MKGSTGALMGLAVGVWLASCGGGTLGGDPPVGGRGNFILMGSGGAAGRGSAGGAPGFGGDGAPTGGSGGVGRAGAPGGRAGAGFGGSAFTCGLGVPACGAQCGNGTRDTCLRQPAPGCPPQEAAEDCDRDDFGSDSCAARGYGSGKLVCSSVCTTDPGGCSECAQIGGPIVRCGPVPVPVAQPLGYALGATDAEVGLATLTYNIYGVTTLSFARLAPSLDPLGTSVDLENTVAPGDPVGNWGIYAIAAAPLPSGWIVAACGDPQVFVHLIDASGRDVARTVVDSVADPYDACISGMMTLAPRPAGGPLLLWRSGSVVKASLIADDGLSAGVPQTIIGPMAFFSDIVSAAWVGDAFYIAATVQRGGGDYRGVLYLVRLQPGSPPAGGLALVNDPVYGPPALTSGAGELRIVYNGVPPGGEDGTDYAVLWRRLLPSRSAPVVVGTPPDTYGPSSGVAIGTDTVVVIGGNYVSGRLAFAHLGSDGGIVPPIHDIARAPYYFLGDFKAVGRGPDVVVAWMGSSLSLARVTP